MKEREDQKDKAIIDDPEYENIESKLKQSWHRKRKLDEKKMESHKKRLIENPTYAMNMKKKDKFLYVNE